LGTLGAKDAVDAIEPFVKHPVAKVSYAAARAMYQLTGNSVYGDILVKALSGDNLQLRRSALIDLGAIGYYRAGVAIFNTLAENSMKLISLKGLLEYQLKKQPEIPTLSPESIKLMELMDGLL